MKFATSKAAWGWNEPKCMINRKRYGLWHSFIVNAQLSSSKSRGNDNNYSCRRAEYKIRWGRATTMFAIRHVGPAWLLSARSSSVSPLSAANLFAFFSSSFFLCFHIHITMRGEASWQTSITSTHTRTHSQKTHARKHTLCQQAVCHVSLQIDPWTIGTLYSSLSDACRSSRRHAEYVNFYHRLANVGNFYSVDSLPD